MNKKLSIIYIPAIILIAIIVISMMMVTRQSVQNGMKEVESKQIWNGVMASSINSKTIKIKVDGKFAATDATPYMNNSMELMIPAGLVRDTFNCAQNLYNNKKLVIEKGSSKAVLQIGKNTLKFNDNNYRLKNKTVEKDGTIFIPVTLFSKYLGYDYSWNSESNTAIIKNNSTKDTFLPEKYSYVDEKKEPKTKDQGNYGTCWAFATLSAIESTLLPEENIDFSEDNLIHNNGLSEDIQDGGDYTMAMGYLMSWKGPVLDKEDPYGDNKVNTQAKAVKHIQSAEIIPSKDYEQIKEKIYKYGGVESSIYMSMNSSASNSVYYNDSGSAYCYKGNKKPNHDVVIIGWDDNYSKSLFNDKSIKEDGAFICKNSWGSDFGSDGVFYISYEDTCIGTNNICYTQIENTDNYDNIYQSDLSGWTGTMGFKNKSIDYFANVYTATKTEKIQAVGFYATTQDLEYEVFVSTKFKNRASLNERNHVAASGKLRNKGYYTIKLDKDYIVKKDGRFAVIVKIRKRNGDDYFKMIPVEITNEGMKETVDILDGEGYFSSEGNNWQSAEKQNCNICLKAYTSNE